MKSNFIVAMLAASLIFLGAACGGQVQTGGGADIDGSVVDARAAADAAGGEADAGPPPDRKLYVSVGDEPRLAVAQLGSDGSLSALSDLDLVLPGRPGPIAFAAQTRKLYIGTRPGDITTVSLDAQGKPTVEGRTEDTGFPVYLALARNESVLVSAYFGGDLLRTHLIDGAPPYEQADSQATPEEPHAAYVDASGTRVYVPHRTGGVTEWHSISAQGLLAKQGEVTAANGTGPRHFEISADGTRAFLMHEFSDSVGAHEVDGDGALSFIASTSSLPDGVGGDNNTGADIHVTPNGKYVFSSNRGHDSIARYEVRSDGSLEFVGTTPTEERPREFSMSPDGRFLVVAGQNSGFIQSLAIGDDGSLTEAGRLEVGPNLLWVIID